MHLLFYEHLINIFLFLRGVELRHFFHLDCLGVSGLCNLQLNQFLFLYIQTLHNDCSHIEDVHLIFCAHLVFYYILGLFVCLLFFALRPMSTAMVIAGRSVHLTTLFPGQA